MTKFRRRLAFLLALCMVFTMFSVGITAQAEDALSTINPTPITPEAQQEAVIAVEGQTAYFSYTPTESAYYFFASHAEDGTDTWGALYEVDNGEMNWIADNDDNGYEYNFAIGYYLEAGTQYVLGASFYEEDKIGSFYVSVLKSSLEQIVFSDFSIYEPREESIELNGYIEYEITTTDGTVYGSDRNILLDGYDTQIDINPLYADGEWEAEGVYPVTVTYMGKDHAVNVTIMARPDFEYRTGDEEDVIIITGCNIDNTVIEIPEKIDEYDVVQIESLSPAGDNATTIKIPDSVTYIEDEVFQKSPNAQLEFTANSAYLIKEDGIIYDKEKTEVISCDETKVGSYVMPESVVKIKPNAFYKTALTSVVVSQNVIEITYGAFSSSKTLSSVTLPEGLNYIGVDAFSHNEALTSIDIPENVYAIEDNAFVGSALTSVTIPKYIEYIGYYAFALCPLTSLNFDVDEYSQNYFSADIGDFAFASTKIKSVAIPDRFDYIGEGAFSYNEDLATIKLSKNITTVLNGAFHKTKWYANQPNGPTYIGKLLYNYKGKVPANTRIIVREGTRVIAQGAFENNYETGNTIGLTSVVLPSGFKVIGQGAFFGSGLEEIYIPSSVTSFAYSSFFGCPLNDIYYEGTTRDFDDNGFYNEIETDRVHFDANGKIPNAPSVKSASEDTLILNSVSGCEYSADGENWQSSTTFKNIKNDRDYTFYQRYKATDSKSYGMKSAPLNLTSISKLSVKFKSPTTTYNGSTKRPSVEVKDSKGNTISSSNYTISYPSGMVNVGTYKVTVTMKGKYVGYKALTYKINPLAYNSKFKVAFKKATTTYDGSTKKPSVEVKDSNGKTVSSSYYTISYPTMKSVGKYKVKVTFKGNYSGYKYIYYTINPQETKITSLTAGTKKLTVKYSKKSSQVTGYQIQYSTSKSFSSYKTKTVSSYKTTSATLSSLSAKRTYYVRVRTYKTVSGTRYYSGWSSVKYMKTK